jgi:hypothetical protein
MVEQLMAALAVEKILQQPMMAALEAEAVLAGMVVAAEKRLLFLPHQQVAAALVVVLTIILVELQIQQAQLAQKVHKVLQQVDALQIVQT